MATPTDAELILKLYDLRRDAALRKARHWLTTEFSPKSADDLLKTAKDFGGELNTYWRQGLTYWEMAAALVLHGALDAELFIDTNGEPLFIAAKLERFREEYEAKSGQKLLAKTHKLIEQNELAKTRFAAMLKRFE